MDIVGHELVIRFTIFAGVLLLMVLGEFLLPRRPKLPRPPHRHRLHHPRRKRPKQNQRLPAPRERSRGRGST